MKLEPYRAQVLKMSAEGYSPRSIARWYEEQTGQRVSHETVRKFLRILKAANEAGQASTDIAVEIPEEESHPAEDRTPSFDVKRWEEEVDRRARMEPPPLPTNIAPRQGEQRRYWPVGVLFLFIVVGYKTCHSTESVAMTPTASTPTETATAEKSTPAQPAQIERAGWLLHDASGENGWAAVIARWDLQQKYRFVGWNSQGEQRIWLDGAIQRGHVRPSALSVDFPILFSGLQARFAVENPLTDLRAASEQMQNGLPPLFISRDPALIRDVAEYECQAINDPTLDCEAAVRVLTADLSHHALIERQVSKKNF
jgi:hypothetical protein